jgi:putative hydrolase of the HAD superfamily
MTSLVVFDGDDTLWSTEALYDQARQDARRAAESAGLDGEAWEAAERRIDVQNVAHLGLSQARFPTSCIQALDAVAGDRTIDDALRDAVWAAAAAVFEMPAPLLDGALETLEIVAATHRLALLTKGDGDVQRRRLEDSGLEPWFDEVTIVEQKSSEEFRSLLLEFHADPGASISIGNSLKSDILPAIEIGMHAIWIDAHVWEWERQHHADSDIEAGLIRRAEDLYDVPRLLKEIEE